MRNITVAISAILFTGLSSAASTVATLNVNDGSVLVNQGKQFVTAQAGQILATGDRVMVMEGGNASIKYADGCVLVLGSGSLAVVGQQSSCASGIKNVAQIAAVSAQAAGDTERDCDDDGITDSQDGDIDGDGKLNADDNYENCKAGAGIWIASGLAAAGAAALISDGDDETISP